MNDATTNETLELSDIRARAVGNALFIEHIGRSGDIATIGVGTNELARDIAGELNAIFNGFRAALADACRKAGEYAHWARTRDEKMTAETLRYRAALSMIGQIIHGNTRVTSRMADAALAGADLSDAGTVEAVASGTWKPSKGQP